MRKLRLLQAAGMALLLATSSVAFADEMAFDPMVESEAVLGDQARSTMADQALARAALLRELDAILGASGESVLGEQVRLGDDALIDVVHARTELLDELRHVSGAE